MRKFAVAFVLLLAVAIAAQATVIKVKVMTANVRAKPDLMAAVVSRATQGALFEVQKKIGNWYEISVVDNAGNIVTGYINSDVVEEVGGAPAPVQQPAAQPPPAQPPAAPAQPSAPPPSVAMKKGHFFFGLGPVLSNLIYDSQSQADLDDNNISKNMRFGFFTGGGYEMPIMDGLSVVPQIYLSTGGCNFSYNDGGTTYKTKYSMLNLIMPIEAKYAFNGPFVAAGAYVAALLSALWVDENGNSEKVTDLRTLHAGLTLGGGYERAFGKIAGMIKGGIQLGLTNIYKDDPDVTYDNGWSEKHFALFLLIGVKI
jgi:hypothetical protein